MLRSQQNSIVKMHTKGGGGGNALIKKYYLIYLIGYGFSFFYNFTGFVDKLTILYAQNT